MLENDPLAMKRPMNAKAVTAPFCSKKILNAFPLKKVNNCREYQNITLVMKVCEVAKMTKNRSVKNCAWMEHSNAIFARGWVRSMNLNDSIFKSSNAGGLPEGRC